MPFVRRDDSVVETRCEIQVRDYYRWLEDPDSEETTSFVKAQNAITMPYLAACPVKENTMLGKKYVSNILILL